MKLIVTTVTKLRNRTTQLAIAGAAIVSTSAMAQAQDGGTLPTIDVGIPFDVAPVITAVLALAVTVMILMAGPKISLQAGRAVVRKVGSLLNR